MKKTICVLLCFCMLIMPLAGCSRFSSMTAQEILNVFIEAGYPIGETSAKESVRMPAGHLSEVPGTDSVSCRSLINWEDTRLAQRDNRTTPLGGTIYVFDSAEDAQHHYAYLVDLAEEGPIFQDYMFVVDNVIMCINPMLGEAQALVYAKGLCQLAGCQAPDTQYILKDDWTRPQMQVDLEGFISALEDAGCLIGMSLLFNEAEKNGLCAVDGISWVDGNYPDAENNIHMLYLHASPDVARANEQFLLEYQQGTTVSVHDCLVLALDGCVNQQEAEYYQQALDDYLAGRQIEPFANDEEEENEEDFRFLHGDEVVVEDISYTRPQRLTTAKSRYGSLDVYLTIPANTSSDNLYFIAALAVPYPGLSDITTQDLQKLLQDEIAQTELNSCETYDALGVPAIYAAWDAQDNTTAEGLIFVHRNQLYMILMANPHLAEGTLDEAFHLILESIQLH